MSALRGPRRRDERGSLSLEIALITPMFLIIFGLITVAGRYAQVEGTMQAATRDAARAATRARSQDEAQDRAQEALDQFLQARGTPQDCRATASSTLTRFAFGDPMTVTTRCSYSIADAGLPIPAGKLNATATFTSVVSGLQSAGEP